MTIEADGSISAVDVDASGETDTIGQVAAPKLAEAIVENQSIGVDAVTGATFTSTAVLTAAENCLTQAGADAESYKVAVEKNGVDETLDYDVVIAGAGGSGCSAALAASENGAKVLLVEKTGAIGGNSMLASGMFAVESSLQAEAGIETDIDTAVQNIIEFNHYLSNGPLTRAIVEKSADTIDWLADYGIELHLQLGKTTQYAHYGENENYEAYSYHKYVGSGAEQFENVKAALEKNGVDIVYGATVNHILTDADGNVTGISAEKEDGGTLTVNAKAAIIATGGFGADAAKVAEIVGNDKLNSIGMPNAGEALTAMVEDAGAVEFNRTPLLHGCQLAESEIATDSSEEQLAGFSSTPLTQILESPLLWVTVNGERFVNEDVVYDTAYWANASIPVGGRFFIVVDKDTLEAYTNGAGGTDGTDGTILVSNSGPGASYIEGDFVELADQAVELGTAFKGSTIEELAANAGMDPETLANSVARYNTMVAAGKDTDYAKSSDSLIFDVDGDEYYAFDVRGVFLGTSGGVQVDSSLRVLNSDGYPINGLYAVGTNAAGYYEGLGYPPYEGLACGFAWNSGRIAGESAAKTIAK
jgi:fumarate reductase flavoprotein subunit